MTLDKLVATDLAALAAESRRLLPSPDDAMRTLAARIRRDAIPAELALVRLAGAFSHRVARAAAGAVALACTAVLLVVMAGVHVHAAEGPHRWTWWREALSHSSLWIGIWLAVLVVASYAAAAAVAHRWLERRLRRDAAPGAPLDVARRLAGAVEGWSIALWIAGIAGLVTLVGANTFVLGRVPWDALWSSNDQLADQLAVRLRDLVIVVPCVAVAGAVVARLCARPPRSRWSRAIDHRALGPAVFTLGLTVGVEVLIHGLVYGLVVDAGQLRWVGEAGVPWSPLRTALPIAGALAAFLTIAGAALWQRSRDRERTVIEGGPTLALIDPRLASLATVFAQRAARSLAGAIAALCTIGVLTISYTSFGRRWGHLIVDRVDVHRPWQLDLFGDEVPLLATIVVIAIATHIVGAHVARYVFDHHLRRALGAARDPSAVARQLVQRSDGWSAGLAIAGVASVASVFGVVAITIGPDFTQFIHAHGPRVMAIVGQTLRDAVMAVAISLGAAVAIGHACARESARAGAACWIRGLEHRLVIPIGLVIIAIAVYIGLRLDLGVSDVSYTRSPPPALQRGLSIAFTIGVVMMVVGHVLRRRRGERDRTGA